MPQPFTISIPDDALADLKHRLAHTRFPTALDGAGWDYGIDAAFLQRFVRFWKGDYDWRAAEQHFNQFAHFLHDIDGETVHFLHVKGEGENRIPLLLTNGWPSNFVELLPLIPLLTRAVNGVSFDLVMPSLSGYGFSGMPRKKGMSHAKIAPLWARLMSDLGYERFLISGSDMGAGVVMALVRDFPERLFGAHYINAYYGFPKPDDPTPEEAAWLERMDIWNMTEAAYAMEQGTKPYTLAVGLNDSPAGLAAWILEKFHRWSKHEGDLETAFDLETLADVVSVYWFTETIGSSVNLYKEAFADPTLAQRPENNPVPHGVLSMLAEDPAPRAWGERNLPNLLHWTELPQGHFPALEAPEEMAADIRSFARVIGL